MGARLKLGGRIVGRLTVLECADVRHGKSYWRCQCECGGLAVVQGKSLAKGTTRSCGCLRVESAKARRFSHGMSHTVMHVLWSGMVSRCTDKNHDGYKNYGARGIYVCERWSGPQGFNNFIADMGDRPSKEHSIDRKDNSGPYSPENCRWATRLEQSLNTRRARVYEWGGERKTLRQWSISLGVNYDALRYRMDAGWPVQRAFTEPFKSKD